MYQATFTQANIYKDPEVHDVEYLPAKVHSYRKVFYIQHTAAENRGWNRVTWISTRSTEDVDDISHP